ncbi:LysR family transcriptional regulator [Escherichia coli]|uniref:LysR family transcriptional regulator n=1 Tax=Escherichia coli TaxID=562 RepID=UPI0023070C5C|nr:LysR family transcriptional regulator [Escherichia coli]WCE56366.1 LysR family transcriptional regulator [Escherichia coli]
MWLVRGAGAECAERGECGIRRSGYLLKGWRRGKGGAALFSVQQRRGVTLSEKGFICTRHSYFKSDARRAREKTTTTRRTKGREIYTRGGVYIPRCQMPYLISHQQHPQVKVRIMEGQLVSMINELRQGELDFTINTYYQGPYDHEFTFEKLLEKQFAIFCRPGHPAIGARSIKQLLDYSWTMPTPHGSYYKQLSELLDDQAQTPQVGVVCETFSACISLVAKSDFLSILPEEMGCDPLHGQGLVMLPVSEILPKAAYYLIQRRDSRQTPLTASLITQFRRECGYLQS